MIGTRAMLKALLIALLEPTPDCCRQFEAAGDYTRALALLEESKTLPSGACGIITACSKGPVGVAWLDEVASYERTVYRTRLSGGYGHADASAADGSKVL